jgi:hypothetical protein
MLVINVFAVAIGNAAAGAVSDRRAAAGATHPLTTVLIATDLIVIAGAVFFALAARARASWQRRAVSSRIENRCRRRELTSRPACRQGRPRHRGRAGPRTIDRTGNGQRGRQRRLRHQCQ